MFHWYYPGGETWYLLVILVVGGTQLKGQHAGALSLTRLYAATGRRTSVPSVRTRVRTHRRCLRLPALQRRELSTRNVFVSYQRRIAISPLLFTIHICTFHYSVHCTNIHLCFTTLRNILSLMTFSYDNYIVRGKRREWQCVTLLYDRWCNGACFVQVSAL